MPDHALGTFSIGFPIGNFQYERRRQSTERSACQYKREEWWQTPTKSSSEGSCCGHRMGRTEGGETCYLAAGSGQDLQGQGHRSQPWAHHRSPKGVEWAPEIHRGWNPLEPALFLFLVKRVQREPRNTTHPIKTTSRWMPSKVVGLCSVSTTGMDLMAIMYPKGRSKRYHGTS